MVDYYLDYSNKQKNGAIIHFQNSHINNLIYDIQN